MSARAMRALLAAAVLATLAPSRDAAATDAGTRSVFAYGAGERALAMGGAYVAAADDASAMYWNVAGLGLIGRRELQLNQTVNMGLGFSESNLALALPSWRWGTLGVSLRHFGVGGIERRDHQNVLIGGEISDSEFEMALGYGRALNGTWTVGGALKLQRQSLAGLGATGVGVDLGLGVSPSWARGARLGLAVRNALEPSLRLDRESLPDPMTIRSGIGYRVPVGNGGLLVEVDLQKPRATPAKLHAGVEYRFMNLAALRAGMNGDVLSAGTGMQWRNLSLDYTFENNPIATAHRVGVSLRLGPSVEEARVAARRAEDEALERRLSEVFQQRQARQIEELMQRGNKSRTSGQFDDALEAYSSVLTIDPGDSVALALQVDCLKGKAIQLERSGDFAAAAAAYDLARAAAPADTAASSGAERCRRESDRRAARNEHIRQVFAAAMDALTAEDFRTARDGFAQVLAQDPKDAEVARMLARTEQALTRRAMRLVEAANQNLRAGRLNEARAKLDEAAKLDAKAPGLVEAGIALVQARQAADAAGRKTASPAPAARAGEAAPASTLADEEVEELYQLGLSALRSQRPADALRYWEHVWTERPGYRQVGDFLKREYLTRGMEAFAAGKLPEAVAMWERVLKVDPNDARAQGYLARVQQQIARSREILGLGKE